MNSPHISEQYEQSALQAYPSTLSLGTTRVDMKVAEVLRSQFKAEPVRVIDEGGSSAKVVEVRNERGDRQVLKYLQAADGVVDGHDLASFHEKVSQIRKVVAEAPDLRGNYVDVIDVASGEDWLAFTMPFYAGTDVASRLRGDDDTDAFFSVLGPIFNDLVVKGYSKSSIASPKDESEQSHMDRLERRWWLLENNLDDDVIGANELVINGRLCRSPLEVFEDLKSRPDIMAMLTPDRLWYPVHGDANTRNILVDHDSDWPQASYRLIDPRGTTDHWDPMYDYAKILFSLSVWDAGLRQGFNVKRLSGPSDDRLNVEVGYRNGGYRGYTSAVREFADFLAKQPDMLEVVTPETTWLERLLFAHAVHLLAEAACRLSDLRERTSVDGSVSPVELSTGHFLFGTLFLNDIADLFIGGRDIDVDLHLSLMPE